MAVITYIGATVAVVVGSPATFDSSGFAAVGTYVVAGEIASWGATGDTSADATFTTLGGRTVHANGAKDGGAIDFTVRYEVADAGQVIMRAQNNGNNDVCVKITDPDGKIEYSVGRIANLQQMERNSENIKAFTGQFRVNSAVVTV